MGASSVLGITNQEALSEDLENDPFLNSTLQRFTCELYYRFSFFLAPLSVGMITSRHYLSEHNKNGERTSGTGDNKNEGDEKQPSKSEVIGSFIGMGMVGFCFGIGLMLPVKAVNENAYKMAEENQVTKESQGEAAQPPSGAQPAQQITKEPQRVTTKNPKKVEAGKRLAEGNHKKREAKNKQNWRSSA